MKPMNKEETARLLIFIKNHFDFFMKDVDEVGRNMMINSWHSFFHDIPVEVMVKVVQNYILFNEKAPTVKQLREEALKIMNPTSTPLSPELAWEKACRVVTRKFGRYNKKDGMEYLRNELPAIARAVNAVGWDRICDATDENLAFRKREFIEYYSEVSTEEKQEYIMPKNMLAQLRTLQLEQSEKANEPKHLPEV
jgi:hypothetical protein